MQGYRRKVKQKKSSEENIKEWTELDFASPTRAAKDMTHFSALSADFYSFAFVYLTESDTWIRRKCKQCMLL